MRRPVKPRDFIMRPHFPRGIVALVHGTTKIGKTWYVLQFARSICGGESVPFFDGQVASGPHRALYISLEVDEELVEERLVAHCVCTDESLARLVVSTEKLSLNRDNQRDWEALAQRIAVS